MEVAFIGLGIMGSGMARNLIKGGHRLRLFDVSKAALEPFRHAHSRIAASPQEAADAADTVMCMLPDFAAGSRRAAGSAGRAWQDEAARPRDRHEHDLGA